MASTQEVEKICAFGIDIEKYALEQEEELDIGNYTFTVNSCLLIEGSKKASDKMQEHILKRSIRTIASSKS